MLESLPLKLFILGLVFALIALFFDGLLEWIGYDENNPKKYIGHTPLQALLLGRFVARLLAIAMLVLFVVTFVLIACTSALYT